MFLKRARATAPPQGPADGAVRLYIGVGPYPIHEQHLAVMSSYGGGWQHIDKFVVQEGTLNYDAHALPFPEKSVDTIYSSHLLEHISHREVPGLLRHWAGLLKPQGRLHLNVPDMEWTCVEFLAMLRRERAGEASPGYFNRTIDYVKPGHDFLEIIYGSHIHDGEYHKSGFTVESLRALLAANGFINIDVKQEVEAHGMGCLIATAEKGGTLDKLKALFS